MVLQNKYAIGCLIMFYEIEMVEEYLQSIRNALLYSRIENGEHITLDICWNIQQTFETPDGGLSTLSKLYDRLIVLIKNIIVQNTKVKINIFAKNDDVDWYNISAYRREFNTRYSDNKDILIWGETDSLFPREMFEIIEQVDSHLKSNNISKYILNFADRKNWDPSWDSVTHPIFENVQYVDTEDWMINNEASSKSYMTIDRMNEINDLTEDYDFRMLQTPKFDGSCLVISSGVVQSGINIPPAVIHCGEDTAFGIMAKRILGDAFVQICVKNILRVHNRRHPRKRCHILNEDNPRGFCGDRKGRWWNILEKNSKYNLDNIFNQSTFVSINQTLAQIKEYGI